MNRNKVYSLLGLATKSGKAASGEFMTEKSVKARKAKLVVVASDASANTQEMFQNMCSFYHVPIMIYGLKEELGQSMGKQIRASVAILDEGFAKGIIKAMEESKNVTQS